MTAVLSLAGGASTAFAGWSAQPTTASPAQLQAAQSYCAANIPDPNTTTQQAVDSRGPYTIIVYAGPAGSTQTYNFCTVGPGFRNASGWTSYPPVTPAAGQLFLWSDYTSMDDGQPYGTMIAQAGAGVTGANLTLTDGTVVTATVQNGWVIAWWPGNGHVASAQLTTPDRDADADVQLPLRHPQVRRRSARRGQGWRARRRLIPRRANTV